ncbi:MAG: GIN domain-containing protein [Brevundimonas sp.]|uniref:GIN domain-containing protein n=1 Tax=Brevundimonas sp. TaxID=1871086 RepID=UPI00391DB352
MKPAYLVAAATAVLALAGVAHAGEVEIRDAVARVVVIPEDRTDIAVEIEHGSSGLDRLTVTRRGADVIIDGGLSGNAVRNCTSGPANARQPGEGARVEVRGHGTLNVSDAPLVVVRTPREVDVSAGQSGGRLRILGLRSGSGGAVFGSIGRGASSIELSNRGCGDWTVANTDGELDISNMGSGSIRAGNSSSLDLAVMGSGDVTAGATGDADISVMGSGNVTVTAARSADISIMGSGDVRINSLHAADLGVSIMGSGAVTINGGEARRVDVSIGGSGDVRFDGRAGDVNVSVGGSGDVWIAEATGSVNRRIGGSGNVRIGNQ